MVIVARETICRIEVDGEKYRLERDGDSYMLVGDNRSLSIGPRGSGWEITGMSDASRSRMHAPLSEYTSMEIRKSISAYDKPSPAQPFAMPKVHRADYNRGLNINYFHYNVVGDATVENFSVGLRLHFRRSGPTYEIDRIDVRRGREYSAVPQAEGFVVGDIFTNGSTDALETAFRKANERKTASQRVKVKKIR